METKRATFKETFGYLFVGLVANFVLGALALLVGIALGGPKIYIEEISAIIAFGILLLAYLGITWWSIYALSSGKVMENLVTSGPYRHVRNPMYGAIVFLLNPALGILFRSWLLLLATLIAYFIWTQCIKAEEADLEKRFSDAYLAYKKQTPMVFPNLYRANRPAFYFGGAALLFLFAFIFLNFSALYLRWVIFEKPPVASSLTNSQTASPLPTASPNQNYGQLPLAEKRANYTDKPNSIIITKLSVNAPLVLASGTAQTELNAALNQGVIIYPGSALPGQDGEVVLSGHSSVYPWNRTSYGQVFSLLDKLEVGDTVSLIYDHWQYDYRITGKEVVGPNDVKIIIGSQPLLKLTTCWPIGTAAKRLVVKGELIQ